MLAAHGKRRITQQQTKSTKKAKPRFETPALVLPTSLPFQGLTISSPSLVSVPWSVHGCLYFFVYHSNAKKINASPPSSSPVAMPGGASFMAPAMATGVDVDPGSRLVGVPVLVPLSFLHDLLHAGAGMG